MAQESEDKAVEEASKAYEAAAQAELRQPEPTVAEVSEPVVAPAKAATPAPAQPAAPAPAKAATPAPAKAAAPAPAKAPPAVMKAPKAPVAKPKAPAAAKKAVAKRRKAKSKPAAKPASPVVAASKVVRPAAVRPKLATASVAKSATAPSKPKTKTKTKTPSPDQTIQELKEKIMATAKNAKPAYGKLFETAQTTAKTAYGKGVAVAAEVGSFSKGNVEAVVASGKILGAGVQALGKDFVTESKSSFDTFTADLKALAAVKSPTELFQLQGKLARRNFDQAVAFGSKTSESLVKLANEAFAPISNRVSIAVDKVSKAA